MSSFTSPLVITLMENGRCWKLVRAFTYRIGSEYSNAPVRVPRGFITDFASIPKFLFWLLPWWAKFNKSSVLHDWFYKIKRNENRKEADDIWYEAMGIEFRNHKHGKKIAWLEYRAVRLFSWSAWK